MTQLFTLSEDAIKKLKADHERLRYELEELRHTLRTLRGVSDDAANAVAVTDTIIPARVGTTPGGPINVQRKRLNTASPRAFVDYGAEVPVYSWIKSASTDPAAETGGVLWIFIEQDIHGVWWFTGQDCLT